MLFNSKIREFNQQPSDHKKQFNRLKDDDVRIYSLNLTVLIENQFAKIFKNMNKSFLTYKLVLITSILIVK